jgi:hypothetical protein
MNEPCNSPILYFFTHISSCREVPPRLPEANSTPLLPLSPIPHISFPHPSLSLPLLFLSLQLSEKEQHYEEFLHDCQTRIQQLEDDLDVRKAEYEASVAEANSRVVEAEDRALQLQHEMTKARG